MARQKGTHDHAAKIGTPFSFEFDSQVRYEAFKALFEAIEQLASNMVTELRLIADIGNSSDWHTVETLQMAKEYRVTIWQALTRLAERKGEPFSTMQDNLTKWSDKYHISAPEWDFLREAAILAIIGYYQGFDDIRFVMRIREENLSNDEIVKLCEETNRPPDMALAKIIPDAPEINLSKLCHLNTWHDRWEEPIPYMQGKLRDDSYLFERLHPLVFAPTAKSNVMGALPEALREKGYIIDLKTHPAENLLYRERALMQANTPTNDPRAKELSQWFYSMQKIEMLNEKIYFPKEYTGIAYDPRRDDWSKFEEKMTDQFKSYMQAYKEAAEHWLTSHKYELSLPLSSEALKEHAAKIVEYFILDKQLDTKNDVPYAPSRQVVNALTKEFFTRGLRLSDHPKKTQGRSKKTKEDNLNKNS